MEKRDTAILIAALVIVMVMAVVVKPILTGEAPDLSLPFQATPTPTPTPVPTAIPELPDWAKEMNSPPTAATTPSPTWSGQSQSLGFVSTGSVVETPTFTHLPEVTQEKENLLPYATIQSEGGGITQSILMPFPYWELHYTVNPWDTAFSGTTSNKEAGQADFLGSEVFPSFIIEVRDASDNSLVRTIVPEGGIQAELWKKGEEYDPRPWVEKFYEGTTSRTYYFVIKPHMIRSYSLKVMVPDRYLGKF
jgi:hypothetical protein